MSEPKWLELAKGQLGTKEVAGKKDNPVIMAYYADAGFPGIDHDEVPWCAAFVGSMLKRAGYKPSGSLAARSYEKYGTRLPGPKEGCIAVFPRGKNSWEGHVGIVASVGERTVKLLGGNQANQVSLASYPIDRAVAWVWPPEKPGIVKSTKVAVKSKTVWAQVMAFVMMVWGVLSNGLESAFKCVLWFIDIMPTLVSDVEGSRGSAQSMLSWLNIPWQGVGIAMTVAFFIIAILRHVDLKGTAS